MAYSREEIVKHAKGLGFTDFPDNYETLTKQQFNQIGNDLNDYKDKEKDKPTPAWSDPGTDEGKASKEFHESDEGQEYTERAIEAQDKGQDTIENTVTNQNPNTEYTIGASLEAQYEEQGLKDDQFEKYLLSNPDLREHSEALGLFGEQASDWARWHWDTYGKDEGRRNEPGNIRHEAGYTEELGLQHYMDPQYFDEGKQRSLEDIFGSSVRGMTPSELWRVRESLGEAGGAAWDLGEFEPEGWRFAQDIPYGLGLLGDELYVREPYGQLGREGDPRFLQDRYEEAAIANDFPAEWVDTSTGKWTGPAQMEGYWDQLTNAIRNEAGWLRANIDLPEGPQAIIPNAPIGSYGPAWGGAGGLPGPGGVGTAGAYTPMEAQDWSGIMPQGVFAGSEVQPTQAMQGLVAGQGLQYQPWAMAEDSVQGVPFVP